MVMLELGRPFTADEWAEASRLLRVAGEPHTGREKETRSMGKGLCS